MIIYAEKQPKRNGKYIQSKAITQRRFSQLTTDGYSVALDDVSKTIIPS